MLVTGLTGQFNKEHVQEALMTLSISILIFGLCEPYYLHPSRPISESPELTC